MIRYLPTALLGTVLLASTAVGFDHPTTHVEGGFGEVAPTPAPHDGLDMVTALGCQRVQRPGDIPTSVIVAAGMSSRKVGFDAAWTLTHQPGNRWNVVGFCYGKASR